MPEKEVAYDRRAASGIIHKNSCHLVGVIVTSKDNASGYIDVYDGENTSQEKVMRVRAIQNTSRTVMFPKPVIMRRGLYVDLNSDSEEYTVFWKPIED